METVAVIRFDGDFRSTCDRAISAIGGFTVGKDETLVIKPNLGDLVPSEGGVTTSVELVRAVVRYFRLQSSHPRIVVVESDHPAASADESFRRHGFEDMATELDIELVNLSREKSILVEINGHYLQKLTVPLIMLECDKFISIAKLKTHAAERISCVLKNQFGMIVQRNRRRYHPYMRQVLADLSELYPPDLCIVDGVVGLEGPGPTFGTPIDTNIVVCGRNNIAVDIVSAYLMGFPARSVPALEFSMDKGLTSIRSIDDVNLVGDKIQPFDFAFIPRFSWWLIRMALANERIARFVDQLLTQVSSMELSLSSLLYNASKAGPRRCMSYLYSKLEHAIENSR